MCFSGSVVLGVSYAQSYLSDSIVSDPEYSYFMGSVVQSHRAEGIYVCLCIKSRMAQRGASKMVYNLLRRPCFKNQRK